MMEWFLMEAEEQKAEHKRKQIVIPGEIVTEQRKKLGQHVFIENGKVFSDSLGITYPDSSTAYVVPLHGKYLPQEEDVVVGVVSRETFNGYLADINSIYHCFVSKERIRDQMSRGTAISAKIDSVNEMNEASLVDVRAFLGGDVIEVSPVKIPRIIGKNGSMLTILRSMTGVNAIVGRNGWIWIKDGDTPLFIEAVRLIEKESHLSNLTNKVEQFLKERKNTEMKKVE